MKVLARLVVRVPWLVVALWVVLAAGGVVASAAVGSAFDDTSTTPGTDSARAADLLQRSFPQVAGDVDTVAWRVERGSATDVAVADVVGPLLARIARNPAVASVISPFEGPEQRRAAQVSRDGQVAFARIQFRARANEVDRGRIQEVKDAVETVADADAADTTAGGLTLGLTGQVVGQLSQPQVSARELVGVAFAAAVLLVVFGSLVAASLPLVTAGVALAAGLSAVGLLSNAISIPGASSALGVLLGLGVGIDYCLFLTSRHRTALRSGRTVDEAVAEAMDTSGRAVVFAGGTVVVSVLSLAVVGLDFITGLGIAAAVVVAFTMLAGVTLLPALLAILGDRVLPRRDRRRLGTVRPAAPTSRWAALVQRRPALMAAAGAAVVLVLAVPVTGLRLGTADQGNDADGTITRTGYDVLTQGFGAGVNGPLLVVATVEAGDQGSTSAAFADLARTMAGTAGVRSVSPPQPSSDGSTVLVQVVPGTSPQDEATADLVDRLRTQVAARLEGRHPGLDVHVGGAPATFQDFADVVTDALPRFFATIVLLAFLLLVFAFRSLVVPALGAVMNVLGATAAFGVVVAVFQWGWGSGGLGVGRDGPVEPFIPVLAFAILFGLSMDYQVFLVSRIHEEWTRTQDNRRAVTVGLTQARPVIIAAALIMFFVFASFVASDARILKLVGTGLAIGVLLAALDLWLTLVPGLMHLLGRANWWLPAWLDRALPHVAIERASGASASGRPGATVGAVHGQAVAVETPVGGRGEERHRLDGVEP